MPPIQNGSRQQKLFPKLLYIMWHYTAIKMSVIQFKSGHSPIITLCKKAAHPTLESPAPATHFFRFPRTTRLQKTRGFAGLTLCFHKNVYPLLKSLFPKDVLPFVFISLPLKSVVFALYFEGATHLRSNIIYNKSFIINSGTIKI